MTIYDPIIFQNDQAPPINASALNYIQAGLIKVDTDLASQAVLLASTIGYGAALAGNIGAQGSAIAAQATTIFGQSQVIASLIAADVAIASGFASLSGAVASQAAAVSSALPQVAALASAAGPQASAIIAHGSALASHGLVLDGLATSLGAQGSSIVALASTVNSLPNFDAIGTTLAVHSSQIAQVTPLVQALPYGNRSGRGPLDLWDTDTVVQITGTYGVLRAVGVAVVPKENWPADFFNFELTANDGTATPLGQFSFGILNDVGSVIAYSIPTTVASVGSVDSSRSISVPVAQPSVLLNAGSRYIFVAASDDPGRFRPYGKQPLADGVIYPRRGMAYAWPLASGLALATYGSFALNVASTLPPVDGLPAIFVT